MREGEAGDRSYVIQSGQAEVVRIADGRAARIRVLGPGDHFGEIALLGSERRTATVRALTPLVLRSLDRSEFESLLVHVLPAIAQVASAGRGRGGPAGGDGGPRPAPPGLPGDGTAQSLDRPHRPQRRAPAPAPPGPPPPGAARGRDPGRGARGRPPPGRGGPGGVGGAGGAGPRVLRAAAPLPPRGPPLRGDCPGAGGPRHGRQPPGPLPGAPPPSPAGAGYPRRPRRWRRRAATNRGEESAPSRHRWE